MTSTRLLDLRPRSQAVLWGGRLRDRQIGSAADLELERRRKRIAELERRRMELFAGQMAAVARLGRSTAETFERLSESFRLFGVKMSDAVEALRPTLQRAAEVEASRMRAAQRAAAAIAAGYRRGDQEDSEL